MVALKSKWNKNASIKGALRRMFARSPVVREVLMKVRREVPKYKNDGSRSKKDAVQYQCGQCSNWVGSTHISVDHIEPVISVDSGFVDWNLFIERLFCGAENLQPICDDCHKTKTYVERISRLKIQYTKELDALEVTYYKLAGRPLSNEEYRDHKKALSVYIKKNKVPELENIAARARDMLRLLVKS